MAETTLVFSATKTSFDPQVQGCLIIGQPRHLQAVSFDHFAEKLSRRVDSEVRSNFLLLLTEVHNLISTIQFSILIFE